MEIEEKIKVYALQNAVKFKGKANPGAIVGQLIQSDPEIKSKLGEYQPKIQEIVSKVNSMSLEDQERELNEYSDMITEKPKEKRTGLKELPNVDGKVFMRIAPSPSGPMHIGHSYVLSLNYEYVKKYGGKLFLRIEDTNPDNIDDFAYDQIPKDVNWICENNIEDVIIQSDRLELYYSKAKELIEKDSAYICTCDSEDFRDNLTKSLACPCRSLTIEENLKRFEMLFDEYKQGDAVMRFKSDINHKNPAMRDFPLMRINETNHLRQGDKFRVWPLMNLSVSVDDMELGITHTLRGKDHADNAKRQALIHEVLGFKTPEAISVGRINFEGFELSTSKTREKIENKEYESWEDVRLPFLIALKRRGYNPESLRKFAMDIGISKTDKTVQIKDFFKSINSYNKEQIESESNRYFFVDNPIKIEVKGSPNITVRMPVHPDDESKGERIFETDGSFYITKDDHDKISNNKIFRLIDCINIKRQNNEFTFDSKEYEKYKKEGNCKIIHWLPANDELIETSVLMEDGNVKKGLSEKNIKNLKIGDIIQFERFSFVKFEGIKDNKYVFVNLHS